MPTLGEMLVQDKVISKGQLEEAIQNQVIFGGRLGTNLIEMRLLDEFTLTKYLARKHGVPTVDWQLLNRIKPSVLKLFTKKLANSAEGFPLKVDGKDIYVVMADPANLNALQEINFATGMNVKPLVLPEIRVYDLLTRFYGIGREMRYIGLAMMYTVPQPEKKTEEPKFKAAPPGVSKQELKERDAIRQKMGMGDSGELMSDEEFQRMADRRYGAEEEPLDVGIQPPSPLPQPPAPLPQAPLPRTPSPDTIKEPAPPPAAPSAPKPGPQKEAPSKKAPPPRTGQQPFKEVAQALYSLLIKNGVSKYIDKGALQEFLKVFVKSQLKNYIIPTSYMANWFIIQANAPVEWIEAVLEEFKEMGDELGVAVVLPGEPVPVAPPVAPAPPPAERPAEAPAEVIEEVEPVTEEPAPPPAAEEPAAPAIPEMMELSAADLATTEEAEAFVPEEVAEEVEEEEEEEEYVQLTLDEARQKMLTEVDDRKDISRIVLGFAKGFFKRSLLFTVRDGTLFGWDGVGPGIKSSTVESIMLPLNEPGVFQLVNNTMSFFLGPMQPGPVNDRFLKLIGNEKPNNVFIMPVVVNEKVVYMLYGDNGDGEFVPVNAPELQILAYQVPQAIDKMIARKKEEVKAS